MAAEVLATAGFLVTIFDRMASPARKFLLAGRGGLNLTHTETLDSMLDRYGPARPQLEAAICAWGPDELRSWCASLGEPTFVGSSGRVFPQSFRATPLLRAWLRRLGDLGVLLRARHRWVGWAQDGRTLRFAAADGTPLEITPGGPVVFALGGASWPGSGSDGGWVEPFRLAGVAVQELRPSNSGVITGWSPVFAERFAGVPLKNVAVSVAGDSHPAVRGDAVVTHQGLEGGPVYAVSGALRAALDAAGRATLLVDLHPDLTHAAVAKRLERRRPKDSLSTALRRSLGLDSVAIGLLREATANAVPTAAAALASLVKAVPATVTTTAGIDRAVSSSGGVALDEIDDRFMLRRRPGTFVVGEMLDWEAPTGGYLLQATLSSAVAAAHGALDWHAEQIGGQGGVA